TAGRHNRNSVGAGLTHPQDCHRMFKLFRQYYSTKVIFLFLTESLLIAGALFASIHLRFYRDPFEAEDMMQGSLFGAEVFLIVSIGMLCFYYNDLYDLTAVCRRSEL